MLNYHLILYSLKDMPIKEHKLECLCGKRLSLSQHVVFIRQHVTVEIVVPLLLGCPHTVDTAPFLLLLLHGVCLLDAGNFTLNAGDVLTHNDVAWTWYSSFNLESTCICFTSAY